VEKKHIGGCRPAQRNSGVLFAEVS